MQISDGRRRTRARLRAWGLNGRMLRELEAEKRAHARAMSAAQQEAAELKGRMLQRETLECGEIIIDALLEAYASLEREAGQYDLCQRRVEREIDAWSCAKAEMETAIKRLSAEKQYILRLRYARRMSWIAISRQVNYSSQWARGIEREAVDELTRILS